MGIAAKLHALAQAYLRANILIRHLRTRSGLKRARALVLVPAYLFVAAIATGVIDDGGPGWLNLLVPTCIWNAIEFAGMALLSPFLLLGERLCARRDSLAAGRTASSSPEPVLA